MLEQPQHPPLLHPPLPPVSRLIRVQPSLTHPSLQPDRSALGLLSLSIAAANADPIPVLTSHEQSVIALGVLSSTSLGSGGAPNGTHLSSSLTSAPTTAGGNGLKQHRRLSSLGKTRRRLSD